MLSTSSTFKQPKRSIRWDIFCQVIDNFGDIGICWRLAAELSARDIQVTLHVDDASALQWMAPEGAKNVHVTSYHASYQAHPDVVIEAFGCEAPPSYLHALNTHYTQCSTTEVNAPVLINLEYLSAESYVERCHKLPSLIMSGPAKGMTRWFFYPGFTNRTGGLLREQLLWQRQTDFSSHTWRTQHAIAANECAISLFCYEPVALPSLLKQIAAPTQDFKPHLLVTPGRSTAAVKAQNTITSAAITYLPARTQTAFDEMLWACDLNFVRGEDSLVRALWAGQAFVWHIYPQHDNAHHAKLDSFLDWLNPPESLRTFHHIWNGMSCSTELPLITPEILQEWKTCVLQARNNLRQQSDLITQLQQFATEKS